MNNDKNNGRPGFFKGVWPAMFSPVKSDGNISVPDLEKLVELLVKEGVDGLYLLGSTGQGFLFNEQQRMQIAEMTISMVDKRLPVIVQVGAMNTDESVRLAKHAYQAGADAISSVGPIYYSGSMEMGFRHYERIARATELPFFPYQIGKAATDELIEKLMQIPNIAGMKLTTLNLLEISSIHHKAGPGWKLFSGADELLCHAALCGTAGAIGTTYNLLGGTCKSVRERFLGGDVNMSMDFMLCLQNLIEKVMICIWTFFRRAMILKHQVDIGDPKPPLLAPPMSWSDEEVMDMVNELESIATRVPEMKIS